LVTFAEITTFMTGILHLHSALRWLVLLLLIATIIDSAIRMYRPFKENERKLALFTLITCHIQLLLGLVLYFFGPRNAAYFEAGGIMKDPAARFFVVEHLVGMVIAIALVTIGYSKAKRQAESWAKHKLLFYYFLFAFILIVASIPWPFREKLGVSGWF
jgi:uncharacterized protein YacL